jgi:hypothetical protein
MGYIGHVSGFFSGGASIRALSSSLTVRQAITHPDVVDGRVDRSLVQLGAVEVEGDVVFPLVAGGETAFVTNALNQAMKREANTGELQNAGDVTLVYAYEAARKFNGCKINTFEIRATAGDRCEGTFGFMGTNVADADYSIAPVGTSPVKVLMWDAVDLVSGLVKSCVVREFTLSIANNLSRNYTFCNSGGVGLYASNISTGKRFVNGTLGFQGWAATDQLAYQNAIQSGALTTEATLGITVGDLAATANNVVYEFQDIAINPALITSTVNWYAHGDSGDSGAQGSGGALTY